MTRKLEIAVSLHNVCEIHVEHCIGASGRKWLTLVFVDETGAKTEIDVWPPNARDSAPTLVADDNVSIRRVKTVKELEDGDETKSAGHEGPASTS